jgi:hypothetical protein
MMKKEIVQKGSWSYELLSRIRTIISNLIDKTWTFCYMPFGDNFSNIYIAITLQQHGVSATR